MADLIPLVGEQPPHPVAMRRCTKCGEEKAITEYSMQYPERGYRCRRCKACVYEADKQRAIDHPERRQAQKDARRDAVNAKARAKYHRNPQAEIERHRQWRKKNPHVIVAWRNANREVLLKRANEGFAKWKLENPKGYVINLANRRARIEASGGKLSHGLWEKLFAEQLGKCIYCPADLSVVKVHMDHIIPLKLNGPHTDGNMQLLCSPCNHRKHAKHPLDFAAEMGIVRNPLMVAI